MICLKNIHKINRYDKDTVRGYINRIEKKYKQRIPLVIQYICLVFYYEKDEFGKRIECMKERRYSHFGMMDIMNTDYLSQFLYQWRFKYYRDHCNNLKHKVRGASDVIFGITDQSNKLEWYNSKGYHIGFCKYGYLYQTKHDPRTPVHKLEVTDMAYLKKRRRWIMPNDEMIISLDIKAKKMGFVIKRDSKIHFEETNIPIVFAYKDQKYRIAVHCDGKGINVELIEFTKIVRTAEKIDKEKVILNQIESEQKI